MTSLRTAKFRYPLQVLLTKHEWDVQTLAVELTHAQQALDEHEAQGQRFATALMHVADALLRMRSDGAVLDLAREQALWNYREAQEEALVAKQAEIASARRLRDDIAQQLQRVQMARQGYENQRERMRRHHQGTLIRDAITEADDAWLLGRLGREAMQ